MTKFLRKVRRLFNIYIVWRESVTKFGWDHRFSFDEACSFAQYGKTRGMI